MQLGHSADEIKYLDTIVDTNIARYRVTLDGEPTMDILCDGDDTEKIIRIVQVGGFHAHDTNGRFTMTTDLLEGPDGMPLAVNERVNEKSVYTYVIPRLHVLLGRLLRATIN